MDRIWVGISGPQGTVSEQTTLKLVHNEWPISVCGQSVNSLRLRRWLLCVAPRRADFVLQRFGIIAVSIRDSQAALKRLLINGSFARQAQYHQFFETST